MKRNYGFKFLQGTAQHPKSVTGHLPWKVGEWKEEDGPIQPCENGFHCVRSNGFIYWADWGPQLFLVEYKGVTVTQSANSPEEKIAAQKMRLVKRIPITKQFALKAAKALGVPFPDYPGKTALAVLEYVWFKSSANNTTLPISRSMAKAVLQEYAPEYL